MYECTFDWYKSIFVINNIQYLSYMFWYIFLDHCLKNFYQVWCHPYSFILFRHKLRFFVYWWYKPFCWLLPYCYCLGSASVFQFCCWLLCLLAKYMKFNLVLLLSFLCVCCYHSIIFCLGTLTSVNSFLSNWQNILSLIYSLFLYWILTCNAYFNKVIFIFISDWMT